MPGNSDTAWAAPTGVTLLRRSKSERIVTLPSGERVRVITEGNDDDGWAQHQEHNDFQDAVVIPRTICYQLKAR